MSIQSGGFGGFPLGGQTGVGSQNPINQYLGQLDEISRFVGNFGVLAPQDEFLLQNVNLFSAPPTDNRLLPGFGSNAINQSILAQAFPGATGSPAALPTLSVTVPTTTGQPPKDLISEIIESQMKSLAKLGDKPGAKEAPTAKPPAQSEEPAKALPNILAARGRGNSGTIQEPALQRGGRGGAVGANWDETRSIRAGGAKSVSDKILNELSNSQESGGVYTVKSGDTLSDIAVAAKKANPQLAGMSDADLISKMQKQAGVSDPRRLQIGTKIDLNALAGNDESPINGLARQRAATGGRDEDRIAESLRGGGTAYTLKDGETMFEVGKALKKIYPQLSGVSDHRIGDMIKAENHLDKAGMEDKEFNGFNVQFGQTLAKLGVTPAPAENNRPEAAPRAKAAKDPAPIQGQAPTAPQATVDPLLVNLFGPGFANVPQTAGVPGNIPGVTNVGNFGTPQGLENLQDSVFQQTTLQLLNDPLSFGQALVNQTSLAPELKTQTVGQTIQSINSQLGQAVKIAKS